MVVRKHVFVKGKVQGVSFRYYTKREADLKDVSGWVKNLSDGRVEAVFEGSEENVEKMVEWCRTGPDLASVEDIDVRKEQAKGEDGFSIIR